MEQHNKNWALFVFSSARVLQSYTIEQLVGLGISWVWMGLEGKESTYQKLKNVDTVIDDDINKPQAKVRVDESRRCRQNQKEIAFGMIRIAQHII